MKLTSCSTCPVRGPRPPLLKFNDLFNEHIPELFFLKYFVRKNCRGGVASLLKWYHRWLRLLNVLFLGRIYNAQGPWHLWDFATSACQMQAKTKKSATIRALGPSTVPYGKYGPGYCITFIKSLDEGLR